MDLGSTGLTCLASHGGALPPDIRVAKAIYSGYGSREIRSLYRCAIAVAGYIFVSHAIRLQDGFCSSVGSPLFSALDRLRASQDKVLCGLRPRRLAGCEIASISHHCASPQFGPKVLAKAPLQKPVFLLLMKPLPASQGRTRDIASNHRRLQSDQDI